MFSVFIIAEGGKGIEELYLYMAQHGYACMIASPGTEVISQVIEKAPDLVLMESDKYPHVTELSSKIKQEAKLPIIALVDGNTLNNVNGCLDPVDDFVVKPWDLREVELRVKRLIHRTSKKDDSELVRCGDLVIDQARCEVSVCDRPVVLTFKEYELLKFLAINRERVFTREALLDKVWGYDYYGGDRTVDVHIKRLRSKIEDSTHTFIDTVRNIGYRFISDV